jgi:DNA polymerase-3 subunit epsilon
MFLDGADMAAAGSSAPTHPRLDPASRPPLRVVAASEEEVSAHRRRLAAIDEESGGRCVWLREDAGNS